ncbi:MAG: hypothetical protein MUE85_15760 [Microscillaceae bacterium]|jgi:hypothetical protein|nr:hypothetical protein [Microscillaceae bacterium]
MRIGIDIGRVIIAGDTDAPNLFFSQHYLQAPAVEGAIAAIQKLAEVYEPENIFLVSKCGETTEQRTMAWLEAQDFFKLTGIAVENVYFCRERAEKRLICEDLDIKVFIDDRFTVLQHLDKLQKLFLFNPIAPELAKYDKWLLPPKKHIRVVENWSEILFYLT